MKIYSTFLIITEVQINTKIRYWFTSLGGLPFKKMDKNSAGEDVKKLETLHFAGMNIE